MKSKDWIKKLVPLAQDAENNSAPYLEAVDELYKQCYEIVATRLSNIRATKPAYAYGGQVSNTDERRLAAYREGLVKWDAVTHGVSMALGGAAPFPLFKGSLLLKDISQLQDRLENKKISIEKARAERNLLMNLVTGLNYQKDKVFTVLFEMIDAMLQNMTFENVIKAKDDILELLDLHRNGRGQSERATSLQMKLFHTRNKLEKDIQSLSPSQQLQFYFLLGQHA